MRLLIIFKNGHKAVLDEKDLDCEVLTVKGHAEALLKALKESDGPYLIDRYTAVVLGEVISVSVEKKPYPKDP